MPVKGRVKAIRPWAGMNIHGKQRTGDFLHGEGLGDGCRGDHQSRVESTEIEIPGDMRHTTKESRIEIMKDVTFCAMGSGSHSLVFKASNGVVSSAPTRSSMEKFGVFIPFQGEASVKALSPEGKLLRVHITQPPDGKASESVLIGEQRTLFIGECGV